MVIPAYAVYRISPDFPLEIMGMRTFPNAHQVQLYLWGKDVSQAIIYKRGALVRFIQDHVADLETYLEHYSVEGA